MLDTAEVPDQIDENWAPQIGERVVWRNNDDDWGTVLDFDKDKTMEIRWHYSHNPRQEEGPNPIVLRHPENFWRKRVFPSREFVDEWANEFDIEL